MLIDTKLTLLFALAVSTAAFGQNAEPNRRLHQLRGSPIALELDAQRQDFWDSPPEGTGKESSGSRHGNEKDAAEVHHGKPIALESNASLAAIEQSQAHTGGDDRRKRRRQRTKQSWRARARGEERLRENLVNVGGRGRPKRPSQAESDALGSPAKKMRSRAGKLREDRAGRNRRRRNRKRPGKGRLALDRDSVAAAGIIARALQEQVAASLEDNPLNLSTTRFAEMNADPAARVLEPPRTSNLSAESDAPRRRPQQPAARPGGAVEREFSRQLEREFAESGLPEAQRRQHDEDSEEEQRLDELRAAALDPERMLGYSRTDEDLPILDLENEVLQRTIEDYNAYVSSSLARIDKDNSNSRAHYEVSDLDELSGEDADRRGDLSCVNGTFLPAPFVHHAVIKYLKSSRPDHEYLEADYECEPGYVLVSISSSNSNSSNNRLLCHDRRWIGRLPVCEYREDKKRPTCADLACDQLCRIVNDRPECSCREGYRQDGASCIDVNECEANGGRGPCQETCHNLEGSFECSCEGSQLAEDSRTCREQQQQQQQQQLTGPCSQNNAGCSHTCLASMGRVFCLCPDGFILEDDWKTCQDVNECAVPDLQTEVCRYGCINTPGSYHCAPAPIDLLHRQIASKLTPHCQPGYQLHSQTNNCIDVDECATDNGGCSEICENTEGSFFCACEGDERILSADRRTCVVAEQRFEKMDREAAALSLRFRQAGGASCSALNPVGRGYLMCSDNKNADKASENNSDEQTGDDEENENDEEEEEEEEEEPEPDGGDESEQRNNDEERERDRTRLVRAGTKCHLKCPRGYELHGEYELTCRSDGTWDGPKHGECLRYSKPRLDCPRDVVAELPAGRDEAFVTYEQPSTDLDWFRYVRSKPSWGTRLEANLKLGLHEVSFFARHPVSKKQASCTLKISVQEGQAPKVENCPSDIEVTGKNGSAISWTEPIFTDNVKVSRVTSTQSPGQTFSLGGHKVEYEAADEAGWTTKCIFTVVLRPLAD